LGWVGRHSFLFTPQQPNLVTASETTICESAKFGYMGLTVTPRTTRNQAKPSQASSFIFVVVSKNQPVAATTIVNLPEVETTTTKQYRSALIILARCEANSNEVL